MQNKDKLTQIKTKLPFGAISQIAKSTGCSRVAVNRFFKGTLKRQDKIILIQNEIVDLLNNQKKGFDSFISKVEEM